MNSLELHQSFADARALRVVIVPVGEISDEKFKEYADLVRAALLSQSKTDFSIVELSNITRLPNDISMLHIYLYCVVYACLRPF